MGPFLFFGQLPKPFAFSARHSIELSENSKHYEVFSYLLVHELLSMLN